MFWESPVEVIWRPEMPEGVQLGLGIKTHFWNGIRFKYKTIRNLGEFWTFLPSCMCHIYNMVDLSQSLPSCLVFRDYRYFSDAGSTEMHHPSFHCFKMSSLEMHPVRQIYRSSTAQKASFWWVLDVYLCNMMLTCNTYAFTHQHTGARHTHQVWG